MLFWNECWIWGLLFGRGLLLVKINAGGVLKGFIASIIFSLIFIFLIVPSNTLPLYLFLEIRNWQLPLWVHFSSKKTCLWYKGTRGEVREWAGGVVCKPEPRRTKHLVTGSQWLLNNIHLRFDSANLALWSPEAVTHKQQWKKVRKQNISHLNFNISKAHWIKRMSCESQNISSPISANSAGFCNINC